MELKFEYVCENENLKENLKRLEKMGYKYIVKVCDKFLSGWGNARGCKHIQLIACYDNDERYRVYDDVRYDKSFSYVNWYRIDDYKGIYASVYNKSFTIRNDWSRARGYICRYRDEKGAE